MFEYLRIILEHAHLSSSHESDEKFESIHGNICTENRLVDEKQVFGSLLNDIQHLAGFNRLFFINHRCLHTDTKILLGKYYRMDAVGVPYDASFPLSCNNTNIKMYILLCHSKGNNRMFYLLT